MACGCEGCDRMAEEEEEEEEEEVVDEEDEDEEGVVEEFAEPAEVALKEGGGFEW